MSETRLTSVVCLCYGCLQQRFRDKDGKMVPGAIVSSTTRTNHLAADIQRAARFGEAQDSDEDSIDENDDHRDRRDDTPISERDTRSHQSHNVSELNLDQIVISSRQSTPVGTDKSNIYDCSQYHEFTLKYYDPAILHTALLAVILLVFNHTSFVTASWFLKSSKGLLTLTALGKLGDPCEKTQCLNFRQKETLKVLPLDIRTALNWMKIDPMLIRVVCCQTCFAMYPQPNNTEKNARGKKVTEKTRKVPTTPTGPMRCINNVFPKEADANAKDLKKNASLCDTDLYRLGKTCYKPVKTYAYQNLYDWIARFLSCPGIESALEGIACLAGEPFDPDYEATDIHHSAIWKEFLGPDGSQYTKQSDNLTFGIFTDGINPYGNKAAGKHASITFVVMVCYSLPLDLRYQPQNVFVVGIAPGPKEPSLEQVNWILRPIVEQLKVLWDTGLELSQTRLFPQGRRIRAAILPFFADLPALRRSLGFPGPTSDRMCSYCLLTKDQITNLDPKTWPLRNLNDHRHWAIKSRDAKNLQIRKDILRDHGVRYSVMLELPYWDILKYHVVDSMHNLLLGLLKWHCRRFWNMSDEDDEAEPKQMPIAELIGVWDDVDNATLAALSPTSPSTSDSEDDDESDSGIQFNRMEFRSHESSDNSFSPFIEAEGWDAGPWTPPSEGKIIFDKETVAFINNLLPRIHTPTWIKRALPVLGKASFGSLKADEWRNLFTIQLPLILPVYWASGGPTARSLFRNFAHLVSMVNVALKRSMNIDKAHKYRHHTLEYLKSSLVLFPDVTLAPNHHMSVHLADCLEKFGPSRAWWSFSMERLMGKILKASHNNRLGQLEITFLTTFCRLGNLQALLAMPERFPAEIIPFIRQLEAFHNPIPIDEPEITPKSRQACLDSSTFQMLIKRLNDLFPSPTGAPWISSSDWIKKKRVDSKDFLSVNARVEKISSCLISNVRYSTFEENPNNSAIALRPDCAPQYGMIEQIFTHRRTLADGSSATDTWLVIQPLLPCTFSNPFAGLVKFDLQIELRTKCPDTLYINHIQEVLAHCAWIKYGASEILPRIKRSSIAIVSLDR